MTMTVKYDRPADNALAVDATLPQGVRNMDRFMHGFATVSGQITFDTSYPTGGYAVPNAKFSLTTVAGVIFEEPSGYSIMYNRTTDKIQVYTTAGTEAANATNLSALQPVYFEARGLV